MREALLDVNVLVWLAANRRGGWASCPVTENGLVRVLAHPGAGRASLVVLGARG